MKIVEYYSIVNQDPVVLDTQVAEYIAKGWQPFGGIAVSNETEYNDKCYAQAVVKYEDIPAPLQTLQIQLQSLQNVLDSIDENVRSISANQSSNY